MAAPSVLHPPDLACNANQSISLCIFSVDCHQLGHLTTDKSEVMCKLICPALNKICLHHLHIVSLRICLVPVLFFLIFPVLFWNNGTARQIIYVTSHVCLIRKRHQKFFFCGRLPLLFAHVSFHVWLRCTVYPSGLGRVDLFSFFANTIVLASRKLK